MNGHTAMYTLGFLLRGLSRDSSGTTVHVKGGVLDSIDGYVVGGIVPSLVVPAAPEHFLFPEGYGALAQWLSNLPDETMFVGAWLNDGEYHFDAVDIFTRLDPALALAIQRNEKAIWDGFTQQEIEVYRTPRG